MTSQAMVKLADELADKIAIAQTVLATELNITHYQCADGSLRPSDGTITNLLLINADMRGLLVAALRLAAAPAASGGVRAGFKPIYVKRWRTLILVPESLADEMRDAFAALTAPPLPADVDLGDLTKHGMNCSWYGSHSDNECTCSLKYRIAISTERTMHRAWRKRAEEAEAAPLPADGVREAIECERQRQIGKGYNAAHDDTHVRGEIATAAAVYALHPFRWRLVIEGRSGRRLLRRLLSLKDFWPWEWESFRPSDRRENLIKAAALTIAEIERLDRAALASPHEQGEG